jgi:hypothetical protein
LRIGHETSRELLVVASNVCAGIPRHSRFYPQTSPVITRATGGHFNPAEGRVRYRQPQRPVNDGTLPGLLALAILMNLIELVLRKWKGLLEALHLRLQTA